MNNTAYIVMANGIIGGDFYSVPKFASIYKSDATDKIEELEKQKKKLNELANKIDDYYGSLDDNLNFEELNKKIGKFVSTLSDPTNKIKELWEKYTFDIWDGDCEELIENYSIEEVPLI